MRRPILRVFIMAGLALAALGACGDNDENVPHDAAATDAQPVDAAVDAIAPDASCFDNPQTHIEIINACTTAQKIYKDSHPPLLLPDGSLPPLP